MAKVSLTILLLAAGWVALRLGHLAAAMTPEGGKGLVVRVYDVRTILEPFSTEPNARLEPGSAVFGHLVPVGGPAPWPGSPRSDAVDNIVQTIEFAIPENDWEDGRPHLPGIFGPSTGPADAPSIRYVAGRLVVLQAPEKQREVHRILSDLARVGPDLAKRLSGNSVNGP